MPRYLRFPAYDPAQLIEAQLIADQSALDRGAENLVAARVLSQYARTKNMSLLGKLQHLTESAQEFHKRTEASLDGISEKIAAADQKRELAETKHHAYYDTIIAGVDESIKVIDRLSNAPLPEDGRA